MNENKSTMIAIMSNKTLEINFRLFHLIKAQNYFVKDFTINKPQLIKNRFNYYKIKNVIKGPFKYYVISKRGCLG